MVGKGNLSVSLGPQKRDSASHLIALESGRSGLEYGDGNNNEVRGWRSLSLYLNKELSKKHSGISS